MTSRRTLNALFTLHSWAGVVTGLLLFIVCFSGAAAVFRHEIDLWANPAIRALPRVAQPVSPDVVVATLRREMPVARIDSITLPDEVTPAYTAFLRPDPKDAAGRLKVALRADTGALIGPVDSELGQFIRTLHVFLFFGPRWIVGFLGVAMLVLIGTGIVIHRKILAELFTQRWDRSLRVVMSDLHKSAGIWGLAFHLLIAATGAWLGLAPVFERGFEYLGKALDGQGGSAPSKAAKEPKASKPKADATPVPMAPIATMLADAAKAVPGFQPRTLALADWERPGATLRVAGTLSTDLYGNAQLRFDGSTGALRQVKDPRREGLWSRVDGLMEPLHFGDFGGLWLKTLYFLLGLTPAFLSLTGTIIWLDSRRQRDITRQGARTRSRAGVDAPEAA